VECSDYDAVGKVGEFEVGSGYMVCYATYAGVKESQRSITIILDRETLTRVTDAVRHSDRLISACAKGMEYNVYIIYIVIIFYFKHRQRGRHKCG